MISPDGVGSTVYAQVPRNRSLWWSMRPIEAQCARLQCGRISACEFGKCESGAAPTRSRVGYLRRVRAEAPRVDASLSAV